MDAPGEDPKLEVYRVILTYVACLYAVMLYDWLNCLKQEYYLVYRAKFTSVSGLYVVLRFWPIIKYAISVALSASDLNHEECNRWSKFQVYSTLPIFIGVGLLLSLRAWAIYERSKIVLYSLLTLLTAMVAVICVAGRYFEAPVFIEGHGPCFAGPKPDAPNIKICLWLFPFLFDLIATILLLARVVHLRRRGAATGGLLSVLLRDGLVFAIVMSSVNLLSVLFYLLAGRWASIHSAASYMIASAAGCRLILSLRQHSADEDIGSVSQSGGRNTAGAHTAKQQMFSTAGAGLTRVQDTESAYPFGINEQRSEAIHLPVIINVGVEEHTVVEADEDRSEKDIDEKAGTRRSY